MAAIAFAGCTERPSLSQASNDQQNAAADQLFKVTCALGDQCQIETVVPGQDSETQFEHKVNFLTVERTSSTISSGSRVLRLVGGNFTGQPIVTKPRNITNCLGGNAANCSASFATGSRVEIHFPARINHSFPFEYYYCEGDRTTTITGQRGKRVATIFLYENMACTAFYSNQQPAGGHGNAFPTSGTNSSGSGSRPVSGGGGTHPVGGGGGGTPVGGGGTPVPTATQPPVPTGPSSPQLTIVGSEILEDPVFTIPLQISRCGGPNSSSCKARFAAGSQVEVHFPTLTRQGGQKRHLQQITCTGTNTNVQSTTGEFKVTVTMNESMECRGQYQ